MATATSTLEETKTKPGALTELFKILKKLSHNFHMLSLYI